MPTPFCLRLDLPPHRRSPFSRPPPPLLFPCSPVAAWHFEALAPPPAPGHSPTCTPACRRSTLAVHGALSPALTVRSLLPHTLRLSRDRDDHGHARGHAHRGRGRQRPPRRLAYRAVPTSPWPPAARRVCSPTRDEAARWARGAASTTARTARGAAPCPRRARCNSPGEGQGQGGVGS